MPVKKVSELKVGARDWVKRDRRVKKLVWIELLRAVIAEFFATFIFVGAVLAAIVNNNRLPDPAAPASLAVGLAVGFAGVATIWTFGDISGAHFNPAITFGFMFCRKISILRGTCYIFAQLAGAVAVSGIMYLIFPQGIPGQPSISDLIPLSVPQGVTPSVALLMEFFLTFCLVYVVFATAVDRVNPLQPGPAYLPTDSDIKAKKKVKKGLSEQGLSSEAETSIWRRIYSMTNRSRTRAEQQRDASDDTDSEIDDIQSKPRPIQVYTNNGASKRDWAALSIGFTLGFLAFLGSSVTGGGFNPARAFGAALVSGNWDSIYVYLSAPLLAGVVAGVLHTILLAYEGAVFSALPEDIAAAKIISQQKMFNAHRSMVAAKSGTTTENSENRVTNNPE